MRKGGIILAALMSLWLLSPDTLAADRKSKVPSDEEWQRMSEKEREKKLKELLEELETPYRKWLEEDVVYIITPEEREAFLRLSTDEEREQFIEQFWLRRDPTPDTIENEYKEEHYRRIAYANERFSSGIPGWKTDRGRIYITFGPPDEIESHPSGGFYVRPIEEGGGTTATYPFEKWRYRYIEGIGSDIEIEFVDPTFSGEYRLTMDPSEKDALLYVPGAGLTLWEELGIVSKADRFTRTDGTRLGVPGNMLPRKLQQFERLELWAKLHKPPPVKFKDLEAAVSSKITYNILPIQVRADFIRITDSTVLCAITVQFQNGDLQYKIEDGVAKAVVNIYGRVTSMGRRIVNVFEDVVSVSTPAELLQEAKGRASVYQKKIPLRPGMYRLNIVAKDLVGGNMNNYELALRVPQFEEGELAASSLILADKLEKVPTREIGKGMFVIGSSKVRPRLTETFKQNERMGIYLQVYNFTPDEQTRKPKGEIHYELRRKGTNEKIFEYTEDVAQLEGASAAQVTIEKVLPLQSLEPGEYVLKIRIVDKLANKVLEPEAEFKVEPAATS